MVHNLWEYGSSEAQVALNNDLSSCILKSSSIWDRLSNKQAVVHLKYGLGRRISIIQKNYLSIKNIVGDRRTEPLSDDEQIDLTMHLNSIYLHIRGAIDNLAWAFCHEFKTFGEISESVRKDRYRVSLFYGKDLLKRVKNEYPKFYRLLIEKKQWSDDLKSLRDPIAHRIPIYAVPAILESDEGKRYKTKYDEAIEAMLNFDFVRSDKSFEELNSIGEYVPVFYHVDDDKEEIYPVDTQIDKDIEQITELILETIELFQSSMD